MIAYTEEQMKLWMRLTTKEHVRGRRDDVMMKAAHLCSEFARGRNQTSEQLFKLILELQGKHEAYRALNEWLEAK